MKHSIFALPALLRPALLLAAASQTTFSVHDDLLAFPQYDVIFADDYLTQSEAQELLRHQTLPDDDAPSHVQQYEPRERPTASDGSANDEAKLEYETMTLGGQQYLCSIPQVIKVEQQVPGNDTLSKAEEEKELARATDRGWELLSAMQGNCVYFISGWWSYKFCYNDVVRQFHQLPPSRGVPVFPPVEDSDVEGFTLGTYGKAQQDGEAIMRESELDVSEQARTKTRSAASGELVQRGENRYLVQRLNGGTKCDLTGRERRIEVQFHCNPQSADRISLIKETSTCTYLMVIQTPRLCNDVAFLPPQKDQPNSISCSPILAESQVDDFEHDLEAVKVAAKEAEVWAANPEAARAFHPEQQTYQKVGDIEIGAFNLVPKGTKIEKSAIVGGGKVTYIDTVASSDGKMLSKEDIEKLGLGDPKAVEKLKGELERIAKGQEWKLRVVDTPRGREYQGIIGSDDEEKDGPKKEGEGKKEDKREGSQEEYYKEEL